MLQLLARTIGAGFIAALLTYGLSQLMVGRDAIGLFVLPVLLASAPLIAVLYAAPRLRLSAYLLYGVNAAAAMAIVLRLDVASRDQDMGAQAAFLTGALLGGSTAIAGVSLGGIGLAATKAFRSE